ncbi:MAG: zinc-binding dehydrogenase, partial [Pseudomonadales bacterium]|nr:zinc-binding dehydrogenase [Pseudomonadales bacterium]
MHAVVITSIGDVENLRLVDFPVPVPGPGEVRVRFTSIGLNRGDILYPEGKYFYGPSFHAYPSQSTPVSRIGFEGAGVVDAVGPDCEWRKGDRVAVRPMCFDISTQGTLAEYGIYREEQLLNTPSALEDLAAGALWMSYLTAWGGLIHAGGLCSGQTCVITAASSAVGLAAIQVARFCGARVIATTTSESKAERLRALGADAVIVTGRDDYVTMLHEFSQQKGSDLVFDAVAGPQFRELIRGARRGSTIVIHGMLDRKPMEVHAGVLIKRWLSLRGYRVDSLLADKTC